MPPNETSEKVPKGFEPNLDKHQTFEVDTKDGKTSKLETGLLLAQITTFAVLFVWAGVIAASIVDVPWINSEQASNLVDVITPIILTVVVTQLLMWLLGRNKIT